jgi:tRNA(adenine34) deaminase
VNEGRLLCVRLKDPVSGVTRSFAPGGAVEAGEQPAHTAARETLEETGYAVRIDPASERIARYPFVWAGVEVDCTTHFFRAELVDARRGPRTVRDAPYNLGAVWLPLDRLDAELGFNDAIREAVRVLCRQERSS